jgi:hypothetical protein
MIEPADALLAVMEKHQVKSVFFIDTLCLMQYEAHAPSFHDLEQAKKQLRKLHEKGHYVFPHIHPHWLDASYISGARQFNLGNLSRYSLAQFSESEISAHFKKSISYLESLGIQYNEWGYRAGGWCIQPFGLFRQAFIENKIKFDFSVLPGYRNEDKNQNFDYSGVSEHEPYCFSNAVEMRDNRGEFTEFPISATSFNAMTLLADRILRKYLWKKGDKSWGDGLSAKTAALKSTLHQKEMISTDILTAAKLSSYKAFLSGNHFMHWISHPKMLTRHGLNCFDQFLKASKKKYCIETDFYKMLPSLSK